MSRIVSFGVLLAFIIIIGALFYKVMIGFLVPVFLAAVLVVVFRPVHRWVAQRVGEREHMAAALTTAIILFVVLLPAIVVGSVAAVQGASIIKNFNTNNITLALSKLRKHPWINLEMKFPEAIRRIQGEMDELQNKMAVSDLVAIKKEDGEISGLVKRLKLDLEALAKMAIEADPTAEPTATDCLKGLSSINPLEKDKFGHAIDFEADDASLEEQRHVPDIIDLHQRAIEFGNHWQAFKEKLLGGPTKTLLVELANPGEDQLRTLGDTALRYVQPRIVELSSATGSFLFRTIVSVAILILSLYFFLYDGPSMIRSIMQLSPLDDRYEQELLLEFDRTARAVVLATILSAVLQGLIAGVGYWFFDMPSLLLLILLTCACALIPFVGPALVWVPVCIYLLVYRDNAIGAAGLAAWGVLIVGTSDNFVKAFVLHGQRQLHPLLALLSVLGGVQTLGPIGILVGPMAVTMLQTLLGILQNELLNFDKRMETGFGISPRVGPEPGSESGTITVAASTMNVAEPSDAPQPTASEKPGDSPKAPIQ